MVTCVYSPYGADHTYSGDLDSRRTMDKVDATMNSINEQREIANEISEMISNPLNAGLELDEVRSSSLALKSVVVLMHLRKLRHAG